MLGIIKLIAITIANVGVVLILIVVAAAIAIVMAVVMAAAITIIGVVFFAVAIMVMMVATAGVFMVMMAIAIVFMMVIVAGVFMVVAGAIGVVFVIRVVLEHGRLLAHELGYPVAVVFVRIAVVGQSVGVDIDFEDFGGAFAEEFDHVGDGGD